MIDVLLTILVFFMTITSAQVLKVDKTIKLPDRKGRAEKRQHPRGSDRERALEIAGQESASSFSTIALTRTRPRCSTR